MNLIRINLLNILFTCTKTCTIDSDMIKNMIELCFRKETNHAIHGDLFVHQLYFQFEYFSILFYQNFGSLLDRNIQKKGK
jgi:hypothetical protein